ncbi:metal-binding protein [Lactiplantibacillus plantarum subsp. plantarum]|nr:metal-binding protein [Lactiplantibacillus plantarum subsp. plantarum]
MDLELYDQTTTGAQPEQLQLIRDLIDLAGQTLKLRDDTEVSVTLMNNDAIQKINEQYRGVDRPTDVISFAMHDDDEDDLIVMDPEMAAEMPLNLGDIMISVDKVSEQAAF